MSRLAVFLIALFCCAGCASDSNDRHNDHLDSLWKQGYGYGNPNVERMRNGQKPVDFFDD